MFSMFLFFGFTTVDASSPASEHGKVHCKGYLRCIHRGTVSQCLFFSKKITMKGFTLLLVTGQPAVPYHSGLQDRIFQSRAPQGASDYVRLAVAWNIWNLVQESQGLCRGIFADLLTYSASAVSALLTSPKILENTIVRKSALVQKLNTTTLKIGWHGR